MRVEKKQKKRSEKLPRPGCEVPASGVQVGNEIDGTEQDQQRKHHWQCFKAHELQFPGKAREWENSSSSRGIMGYGENLFSY